MHTIIQFLQENANILELVIQGKVSLLGVTEKELAAILEAFSGDISPLKSIWQG